MHFWGPPYMCSTVEGWYGHLVSKSPLNDSNAFLRFNCIFMMFFAQFSCTLTMSTTRVKAFCDIFAASKLATSCTWTSASDKHKTCTTHSSVLDVTKDFGNTFTLSLTVLFGYLSEKLVFTHANKAVGSGDYGIRHAPKWWLPLATKKKFVWLSKSGLLYTQSLLELQWVSKGLWHIPRPVRFTAVADGNGIFSWNSI